jgi:hypothetical protein
MSPWVLWSVEKREEVNRAHRSEAKGVPSLLLSAAATANAPPPPRERPPPPPPRQRPVVNPDDVVLDYDDPLSTSIPEPPESEYSPSEPTPKPEDPHYYFTESTYISLHPSPLPRPPPPHHASTLTRFTTLRNKLGVKPPRPSNPGFPKWRDNKAWRDFVSMTIPRQEWLWAMQQWEVVRLVKEFTAWIGWRTRVRNAAKKGVAKGWGVWIWGLLVRCEIVMVAEDVSVLRELGKIALTAWKVLGEFREEEEGGGKNWDDTAAPVEPVADGGQEVTKSEETSAVIGETPEDYRRQDIDPVGAEDCAARKPEEPREGTTKEQEPQELEEGEEPEAPPPKIEYYNLEDTMGMMDMIVSIIGDFFGQRDLMEERAALG